MHRDQPVDLTAGRDLSTKAFTSACYAPFTSMFLDPHGNVLACCQNTDHPLGNVRDASLLELWRGPRADALRDALRRDDLSQGCRYCAWQRDRDSWSTSLAVTFDQAPVPRVDPPWPRQIEFAISTTCNLECVMCNGDWSSKIRSRRERRPPLPKVYGEAFFEELRQFLPHLEAARFLGGEPFVAAESLRIMDLMIDEGLEISANVQTNGTQWNDRVARILDRLPLSITVSLDGLTRDTVESIRVGASYDDLMANLARYRTATRRWGTPLDLAFCFMVQNAHEFGDFLRFADELESRVWVVSVAHPSFSPYQLPAEDFSTLVASLEAQDEAMRAGLGLNRPQWIAELARLRSWRDREDTSDPASGAQRSYVEPGPLPVALRTPGTSTRTWSPGEAVERVLADLPGARASVARCDERGDVIAVGFDDRAPSPSFVGLPAAQCIGGSWGALAGRLGRRHGVQVNVLREEIADGACDRHVVLGDPRNGAVYVRLLTYPEFHEGALSGSVTAAAWSTSAPDWARAPG